MNGAAAGDGVPGSRLAPPPTSHFWPFMFLLVLVVGCGAFGLRKVKELRSADDYWGQMRRSSSGSMGSLGSRFGGGGGSPRRRDD